MTLEQTVSAIRPLDEKSMTAAQNRFANIAMPLGGLGRMRSCSLQVFLVSRCRIFPDARR